jgi:hypothetical protein
MADEGQDIFGKIDAILGKRAGFAGKRPELEDEFPMLTEVVSEGAQIAPGPTADAMSAPEPVTPLSPVAGPAAQLSDIDIDRLAAALEARLSELFIRQQLRIESLVRQIVREELARKDPAPPRL